MPAAISFFIVQDPPFPAQSKSMLHQYNNTIFGRLNTKTQLLILALQNILIVQYCVIFWASQAAENA